MTEDNMHPSCFSLFIYLASPLVSQFSGWHRMPEADLSTKLTCLRLHSHAAGVCDSSLIMRNIEMWAKEHELEHTQSSSLTRASCTLCKSSPRLYECLHNFTATAQKQAKVHTCECACIFTFFVFLYSQMCHFHLYTPQQLSPPITATTVL